MRYSGISHLDHNEQVEALQEGASFLLKSRFQDRTISLYKAEDFLVEVWYSGNDHLEDVKALKMERLTPLLKHFAATCLN